MTTKGESNQSLSEPLTLLWSRFRGLLASPVDGASLALFRIFFGLVMVWEAYRYLVPENGLNRIQRLFTHDHWHFPYHGFEWVVPWSETGMHIHFWLLGVLGLCVALGLFYRVAAVGMFLAFTYIFLLDAALYLNHFYLMCLLSFLLVLMPANRCWSVDAWLRSRKGSKVNWAQASIPFWPVFLLRAQLFIVYFYAGAAKLGGDWLSGDALQGVHTKVTTFLNAHLSLLGQFDPQHVGLFMAWGGMFFDLSIGFLLIIRRTRLLAILLSLMFHTLNHFVFPIGVFPIMAFTATLIFLDPDWPRCVWTWLRRPRLARPDMPWLIGGCVAIPIVGAALGWRRKASAYVPSRGVASKGKLAVVIVCAWVVVQLAIPMRHFWVEGNPEWTEESHRFSWRMMLKSKSAIDIKFDLQDQQLIAVNEDGRPRIDWAKWPSHWPRVMHVNVDSQNIPWNQLPNMVCIYEPSIGVRLIENPLSSVRAGDGSLEARTTAIRKHWQKAFGREPSIHRTTSLLDAIEKTRLHFSALAASGESDQELLEICLDSLDLIEENYKKKQPIVQDMLDFSDSLNVVTNTKYGDVLRRHLTRTHPFSVQASRLSGHEFLTIEDSKIDQDQILSELGKLYEGKPYVVLVDSHRLRYEAWTQLPAALIVVEMGQPSLIWNCFHELTQRQVQVMTKRPYMAHQYARRIANLWQESSGRRPDVHVTAVAVLNQRKPQLIIDPSVDLASAPLRFFGHNEWIFQADSANSQQVQQELATAPRRNIDANREVVERYADGTPKEGIQWNGSKQDYTVVKWHENGQIALLAEYKNNQPHGKQTKWRADGTLLLEMHFENGKPHGLATSWDENGKLAEKAEFFEGRQVNFEEKSKASAIPATAERTERTKVDSSLR